MKNILTLNGWVQFKKTSCPSKELFYNHTDHPGITVSIKGCRTRNETYLINPSGVIGQVDTLEVELNKL